MVGIPKFVYVNNIIEGIINKDIETSLNSMNDVLDEGKDLENFLWEMIKYVKDILMYKVSKKNTIYSEEEIKNISEISEKVTKEKLIDIIYKLSELENKMKWSTQKTIIFETEIIKLCVKEESSSLEDRISKIEKQLSEGKIKQVNNVSIEIPKPKIEYKSSEIKPKEPEKKEEKKIEPKESNVVPEKLEKGDIVTGWQNVLGNLKKQGKVILYANLINTEAVKINDMTVEIRFHSGLNSFRKELLQKPENMNVLIKEISIICGNTMQIKLKDASNGEKVNNKEKEEKQDNIKEDQEVSDLSSLDIPINFIEE